MESPISLLSIVVGWGFVLVLMMSLSSMVTLSFSDYYDLHDGGILVDPPRMDCLHLKCGSVTSKRLICNISHRCVLFSQYVRLGICEPLDCNQI